MIDPAQNAAMPPPPANVGGIDPLRLVWRWKWLILLGGMIGGGLGFLQFMKMPPQYMARAQIQVVQQASDAVPMKSLEIDGSIFRISRSDEAIIIASETVLLLAVEKGELLNNSRLKGMTAVQIAGMIKGGLDIQPAASGGNTTIINITYRSDDPDLATDVIGAVVVGYNEFLNSEYNFVSTKLVEQVETAKKELSQRYKELNTEFDAFRKNAPLTFIGEEGKDPFVANIESAVSQLGELDMQAIDITSTIKTAEEALAAKRDPTGIIMMLEGITNVQVGSKVENTQKTVEAVTAVSRAEQLRETNLLPLALELEQLKSKGYGDNHPAIQAVKIRKKFYENLIAKTAEIESQQKATLSENLADTKDETITSEMVAGQLLVGLREKLLKIKEQQVQIEAFRDESSEKSRELQSHIQQQKILFRELENTDQILLSMQRALDRIDLSRDYGRRSMKQLEMTGGFQYGPSPNQPVGMGVVLGALLFGGLALLLELADRSYRSPEEISYDLGLPILGHVPSMDGAAATKIKDSNLDGSLVTFHKSRSAQAESFRGVRTAIYFNNRGGEIKVIQVTSPVPGDGKSTMASNLAVTIAQSGRKVILVEGDFRRPRVAKIFGCKSEVGVAQVVAGEAELADAIQTSSVDNLSVLACGKKPSNPAELLSSNRFGELLLVLREKFDYVIIDTPPLLAVSDPANVAARVDGVILTLRLRRNLKPLAGRATQMLQALGANVLGVVVNGVSGQGGYGGGYRYGSGYGYGYRYGYGYKNGYGYGYGYGAPYGYGSRTYGKYYEEEAVDTPVTGQARGGRLASRTAKKD